MCMWIHFHSPALLPCCCAAVTITSPRYMQASVLCPCTFSATSVPSRGAGRDHRCNAWRGKGARPARYQRCLLAHLYPAGEPAWACTPCAWQLGGKRSVRGSASAHRVVKLLPCTHRLRCWSVCQALASSRCPPSRLSARWSRTCMCASPAPPWARPSASAPSASWPPSTTPSSTGSTPGEAAAPAETHGMWASTALQKLAGAQGAAWPEILHHSLWRFFPQAGCVPHVCFVVLQA